MQVVRSTDVSSRDIIMVCTLGYIPIQDARTIYNSLAAYLTPINEQNQRRAKSSASFTTPKAPSRAPAAEVRRRAPSALFLPTQATSTFAIPPSSRARTMATSTPRREKCQTLTETSCVVRTPIVP